MGKVARFALTCAALAVAAPAGAQEAPPPATVEGARTFTPADFTRFAPRNALDMLRQVPGFVIREAAEQRGLGQATGNVLINGERVSGKSNDALTELSRVPAQNVVRIEVLDGATLDVPGLSGQVANIVTQATGISGQFAWQPEFRARFTDPLLTRGSASVSGKVGRIEYTIGLENNAFRSGAGGPTRIFDADGGFVDLREDVFTGNGEAPKLSGKFGRKATGGQIANLNLSVEGFFYDFVENGERSGPGLVDRRRRVTVDQTSYEYEIGGDYEFALAGGRLKLIALDRFEHEPFTQDVVTSFADLEPSVGNRFSNRADFRERIGRAEYRWKALGGDWQLSGEAAFNSLDNRSTLFDLMPGGDFEEVPLPGGTAKVEEDRYEVVASHGRTLSPKLSVQLSAGGEYSTLSQSGENGLTRDFWRPKGSVAVAWKPSPRTDVNVRLQRRVGQLNFFDFVATVNLSEDRENAGNPNLVPQQSWEAEVEATRNLGPWGTATLRAYGQLIDDIVDIVPIGETGESPGNIDRATLYGAEFKGTINFDPLGWRGAKLDTRVQLQGSRLEDPLTGETRPISNSLLRLANVSLRHDIPATDWAWGGSASYQHNALNTRLTEVGRSTEGPVFANLFIEHKDVLGLAVRATAGNLLGADSTFDRTVYAGRRTGPVAFVERRDRVIGPIFSFSVRGTF